MTIAARKLGRRHGRDNYFIEASGTTNTSLNLDLGSAIVLDGKGQINLTIENEGDEDLESFALLVQAHPSAEWVTMLSGTDWQTATRVLLFTGQDANSKYANTLTTLLAVMVVLDIGAPYAIKFQAQSASGGKTVTVYGTAR